MTDRPTPTTGSTVTEPCSFGPSHEPWMCTVHPGGGRTRLDQSVCSVAATLDIHPLTADELAEFDAWAASREPVKPVSTEQIAVAIFRLHRDGGAAWPMDACREEAERIVFYLTHDEAGRPVRWEEPQ